jgi:transcriptional regulator with XRE-family HTH domain/tetratricopeptide (TPR) repeat protein
VSVQARSGYYYCLYYCNNLDPIGVIWRHKNEHSMINLKIVTFPGVNRVEQYDSFGYWVRRRRKMLDLTQNDLADLASCSLSMLRKIERDERRPSKQLAVLLADQLDLNGIERENFLQLARGIFPDNKYNFIQPTSSLAGIPDQIENAPDEKILFVSRHRQLLLLHEHLSQALSGRGKLVFISGEAGRGKTSLLHEFTRLALEAHPNLIVAGGSSDVYTGHGDPLLPFRDIFRMLTGSQDASSMSGLLDQKLAVRLGQAVPLVIETLRQNGPHLIGTLVQDWDLDSHLAKDAARSSTNSALPHRYEGRWSGGAPEAGPELRQDQLFDELSRTINALSRRRPLLLLLDDLHWIDSSTASLLGHLMMRIKQSRILIVGSYRPEELAARWADGSPQDHWQHPLQEPLSESMRQFGPNRIDLDRSDSGEELEFVSALLDASDNQFDQVFRQELATLTEGHPLFLVELLRDMRERGDIFQNDNGCWEAAGAISWDAIPPRVEGVIEKRVSRLPDELRSLLASASVQGEAFYAEVVAQAAQVDARQLAARLSLELDQRHRLIQEQGLIRSGGERLSRYRFRHHLFQKYIYEHLAPAERMYLHEGVGLAMEALLAAGCSAQDVPAIQLARHFQEAGLPEKAAHYLLRAGRSAAQVLAFDEAQRRFEQGLLELEKLARTPPTRRLEFELTLAGARALWHSGHVVESVRAAQKAVEVARSLDDGHALAEAVLAYEEPRWRLNLEPEFSQTLMREALAALGDEQSGWRVRLLVALSRSLLAAGEQVELLSIVDQALQIARQIEDPLALCDALRIKVHIDRRPESTKERLAAIEELIATTESLNELERLADGLDMYVYDLLELGQIEQADQLILAQEEVAQEIQQPFQLHVAAVFKTMRAILKGEFSEAEQLANAAADYTRQIGIAALDGIFGMHMFTIRREQGRIGEIAPVMKHLAVQDKESETWRPGLALIYSVLGQRDECRTIFSAAAAGGFALVPRDSMWVCSLAYLAEVCAYLEDREQAEILYRLLLPFRERAVVAGGATVCLGAVGRFLGLLAKTRGDWEAAESHFQEAIELDKNMASRPWLAHSQYEYAAMLLERGLPADRSAAQAVLAESLVSARRMGMVYLVEKIAGLQYRSSLEQVKNDEPVE